MIDIKRIHASTGRALMPMLRDGVKIDEHDTVRDVFDKWLKHEGIIGYTDAIIEVLDGLRAAQCDG